MYSKLALKNLKRSFKDYTIYFLTLVFGVCIFYTFNAIESQSIMMELSENEANAFELINDIMGIASIFISFILGFLIIYSNNYLIKRRKKEFGIYMTLGMEKGKLSRMIFIETLVIGIISLIAGLGIGIILSQGLSVFTAKMFKVNLIGFKFIFSKSSFWKTIGCFGGIYIVVLLFNSVVINKVELIDLITACKKNEKLRAKNIWVSVMMFFLSIAILSCAYYIALDKGIATISLTVDGMSIILGVVGTILFFFSLTGFLLKLVQSNKKHYLKDLNMFVLRQINSKINTTFISMSFICLMLFVSICTFSGGMGVGKALNEDVKSLTNYDRTFWGNKGEDIEEFLKEKGLDVKDYAKEYVNYRNYKSGVAYGDFFSETAMEKGKNFYPIQTNQNMNVMKLSSFNEILNMLGEEKITLEKGQYTAFGDIDSVIEYIQEAIDNKVKIVINENELLPAEYNVKSIVAYDQIIKSNFCTIVVDDEVVKDLTPIKSFLNINYKDKNSKYIIEEKINKVYDDYEMNIYTISREDLLTNSAGMGMTASYLAIYMGIVFLIASSAILALQQLSESTDNAERYKLLRNIGVDDKIINRSVFMQVSIYFIMPLVLAIVHSIVGLILASHVVSMFGDASIVGNIIVTAVILVIVYGGYFMATYLGAKKNIR